MIFFDPTHAAAVTALELINTESPEEDMDSISTPCLVLAN
jgi:hypothetical protein